MTENRAVPHGNVRNQIFLKADMKTFPNFYSSKDAGNFRLTPGARKDSGLNYY